MTITAARGGWLRNGKLTPLLHSVLMVTLQVEFRKAHERRIQNLIQCIKSTMIKIYVLLSNVIAEIANTEYNLISFRV